MNSIVIFVKYPTPGKVKTRLGAQVGNVLAANLYRLFMEQTFTLVKKAAVSHVFVAYEPAELLDEFNKIIPPAFHHFPQIGENLGQRLIHAFEQVFSQHSDKVIILGSDSPTLPIEIVGKAFNRLKSFDLVLGPAEDGGYYLIGLKQPNKQLFENIQWSSTSVLQAT
ncbi:MAG: TIGR04282 family arsenosugar biosynthesis glycosyltransferase, partial [bacterium]